jgi:hypothetical protein
MVRKFLLNTTMPPSVRRSKTLELWVSFSSMIFRYLSSSF